MSNQVFGLILCGIGAVVGYRGYMNYQGHCWEEGRYLTEQEKIHRTIEDVLRRYPPGVIPMVRYEKNGRTVEKIISIEELGQWRSWSEVAPEYPVSYKGLDDFLLENQNCCELRSDQNFNNTSEFGVPSFFDKITGTISSYIRIRYWVKYIEDGKEQRLQAIYYGSLSNCGKPSSSNIFPGWQFDR